MATPKIQAARDVVRAWRGELAFIFPGYVCTACREGHIGHGFGLADDGRRLRLRPDKLLEPFVWLGAGRGAKRWSEERT